MCFLYLDLIFGIFSICWAAFSTFIDGFSLFYYNYFVQFCCGLFEACFFFYKSEKRSKYGLEVRWGGTGRSNESRILISKRIEYIVRDKNVLLVKRKKIKEIKNNPLKAKHHFGKFDSINENTISLLSYMKKKVECYWKFYLLLLV